MMTERNRSVPKYETVSLRCLYTAEMTAARSVKRRGPQRRAAGSAVLSDEVTEAIRDAVFAELAETGYARMSMEAVARRARAGKAAIYRRWPSKAAMVLAMVSQVAANPPDLPRHGVATRRHPEPSGAQRRGLPIADDLPDRPRSAGRRLA